MRRQPAYLRGTALSCRQRGHPGRGNGHISSAPRVSNEQLGAEAIGVASDARVIDNRVRTLSEYQLLERYRQLVDRRLEGSIGVADSFELDRIEARMNVQDQSEMHRVVSLQNEWKQEREAILDSIEQIVAQLKASA